MLLGAAVREVIPEAQTLLDEILNAQVAADLRGLPRVEEKAGREARSVRGRVPLKARVIHLGFVQPRAGEAVVPGRQHRHVLAEVDRFLERLGTPKVTDVRLMAVAEAQLRGGILVDGVVELPEQQRLPER